MGLSREATRRRVVVEEEDALFGSCATCTSCGPAAKRALVANRSRKALRAGVLALRGDCLRRMTPDLPIPFPCCHWALGLSSLLGPCAKTQCFLLLQLVYVHPAQCQTMRPVWWWGILLSQ